MDNFVYVREGRSNVPVNDDKSDISEDEEVLQEYDDQNSEASQSGEDEEEDLQNTINTSKSSSIDVGKVNSNDTTKTSTSSFVSSTPLPVVKKRKNTSSDKTKIETVNKKKSAKIGKGTKNEYLEEMELNLIRDLGKSMKNDEPKVVDEIDLYTRSLAADLRKLTERQYFMAKHEIQGVIFKYQMARLGKDQ